MKKMPLSRLRAALALSLVTSVAACVDSGPSAGSPTGEGSEATRDERPDSPNDPAVGGTFLRVTGVDGGDARIADDGKLHVEVRLGRAASVRTVGLDVVVEGADVLAWERDDAFLRSTGGKLVALESRLDGNRLSVVAGTTTPVSTDSAAGERLLSLVLEPTADTVRVALETTGDMRGVLDASGVRIDLDIDAALIAREGE